jgi:enoyl-CoA hydratase/carnithine racemase
VSQFGTYDDIAVTLADYVAMVEIQRPPHNFFDFKLIAQLADAFEALDDEPACRVLVLAAQGKSFCAGANFGDGDDASAVERRNTGHLYQEAVRLFRTRKPVVGAIHGPAVGGGLGLALVPDLRVTCAEARFSANFTRLGFHPGFGLTVTLPALIGPSKAALLFYTSRRVKGEEAYAMGLADMLVPQDQVRRAALELAGEIATCAPLGVIATRATLRQELADRIKAATDHELSVQMELRETADFREGIKAMAERRIPRFTGK